MSLLFFFIRSSPLLAGSKCCQHGGGFAVGAFDQANAQSVILRFGSCHMQGNRFARNRFRTGENYHRSHHKTMKVSGWNMYRFQAGNFVVYGDFAGLRKGHRAGGTGGTHGIPEGPPVAPLPQARARHHNAT